VNLQNARCNNKDNDLHCFDTKTRDPYNSHSVFLYKIPDEMQDEIIFLFETVMSKWQW
jgi:hypothetical protein